MGAREYYDIQLGQWVVGYPDHRDPAEYKTEPEEEEEEKEEEE